MVKHTQATRQLLPMNCLSVFNHFVGLAFKGVKLYQVLVIHKKTETHDYDYLS